MADGKPQIFERQSRRRDDTAVARNRRWGLEGIERLAAHTVATVDYGPRFGDRSRTALANDTAFSPATSTAFAGEPARAWMQDKADEFPRVDAWDFGWDEDAMNLPSYWASVLAFTMGEWSEDMHCAGWLHGLEFDLWGAVLGQHAYGVSDHLADRLRDLSRRAGGWIVWAPEVGRRFVPLAEWLPMFEAGRP